MSGTGIKYSSEDHNTEPCDQQTSAVLNVLMAVFVASISPCHPPEFPPAPKCLVGALQAGESGAAKAMTIPARHCNDPPDGRPELPYVPAREPRKKALLIGIQYNVDRTEGANPLNGPHSDVAEMRQLLIGLSDLLTVFVFSNGQLMLS